ncbi:MAG: DegV family EDD domain-containing protein, partial [Clostridia bacterium]|nr:DegV family EDD domain-containing protein [Clostridia bacterium]
MAIKILIDSASDIGKAEADRLGIAMIPMTITFGDKDYFDGVDLSPDRFYEKLVSEDELPKTGQVTAYRFKEAFDELTGNGDEVICITISSKLSGTYNGACLAAH